MMQMTFKPLLVQNWGREPIDPRHRRSRSTFSASYSDTLDLLEKELRKLGARELVIEADFAERDIKLDGLPRSNARAPQFPGVRIIFESHHGQLTYQTDTCVFWQHNLRSIALGLTALRKVDLYGITNRAEQYVGFKALASSSPGITKDDAIACLLAWAERDVLASDPEAQRRLVRRARARAHPDQHGGDHTNWNLLEGSIRYLKAAGVLRV